MRRLDDRELQAEAPRDLDPGELAGVVQQLQQQLDDEIEAEPGRLERHRRRRMERRRSITVILAYRPPARASSSRGSLLVVAGASGEP